MNYKEKFQESDKKALNSLIATKILDLMDKLRLDANENAKRRWIWELIQNAKDVAFDSQQVETEVNIQAHNENKSVSFSHNGKPFSVDNITFLIKQVSTKERTIDENNEKPRTTGKFGTGFLTTHLLSEKVEVSGIVKEPDLDYRKFVLPLDRSGRSPEQIIESVNKSIIVRDTLDNQSPIQNYNPREFNTIFKYNLDDEGYKVALVGVEDLHISLPFTLSFLPGIKSVSIRHEDTTYELAKIENETSNIQISTILKKTLSDIREIRIVTLSKNETTIGIEIESRSGKIYVKGFSDEMPRLFCDFPLIGTNDFTLPIVINSSAFNPTEPRDGVWLTDHNNEPKILENKQIIQDSIELYFELLEYASENEWQHLFNLVQTETPKEKKWFSTSWFEKNFQKPIREKILITPILDNINGKRIPFLNEEGKPKVWFPSSNNKEVRERIWELSKNWIPNTLPQKNEIHNWYEIIWNECSELTLRVIANTIQGKETILGIAEMLSCNENEAIAWLNLYYDLLNFEGKFIQEVINDKFAIIPNQNGVFKKRSELRIDENIDEELKNALHILGTDIRSYLKHTSIKTKSIYKETTEGQILYNVRNQVDVIDEINRTIKEGKNENISKACDYLSSCFSDQNDFPGEQNIIYEFCKAIWDMPEKRKIANWSKSIWQEVNKLQIKRIIHTISECKSIEKVQESLKLEKQDTLKWLNSLIGFLINYGYEDRLNLKTSPILPNQNGNFCIKDDLFLDNGEIDEVLKDILESLDYELREELLDLSIYLELPKNRERNQEFVANEISRLITPKFSEVPRTDETRKIFRDLYLWFNKDKETAEKYFSFLYLNKHKLFDDEEIAMNMKKAEKLDSIMQEFNLNSEEELRERLSRDSSALLELFDFNLIDNSSEDENIYKQALLFIINQLKDIKINTIDQFLNFIDNVKADNILVRSNPLPVAGDPSTPLPPGDRQNYAIQFTMEAISKTVVHLKELGYEFLMDSYDNNYPTIFNVRRSDRTFKIVIRPCHGRKYKFYYDLEFNILKNSDAELWLSDGNIVVKETFDVLIKRIFSSGATFIPTVPFVPGKYIG